MVLLFFSPFLFKINVGQDFRGCSSTAGDVMVNWDPCDSTASYHACQLCPFYMISINPNVRGDNFLGSRTKSPEIGLLRK